MFLGHYGLALATKHAAPRPPPSAEMLAWFALLLWSLPLWAHRADRHRSVRVVTP